MVTASALGLAEVPIVDYGSNEAAMVTYRAEGTERALGLANRGPIVLTDEGLLHPDIVASYTQHGFYVFTGVLEADELADIEADVAEIVDRAPVGPHSAVDRRGRVALGAHNDGNDFRFVRPLSDPLGGTDAAHGRHPSKMNEPVPPPEAPDWVVQIVSGSNQYSDACLRTYAHPKLLAIAETLNGPDFTPFNEVIWIKHPGLGGSVAWHQDGWTHWDSPRLTPHTHGFNFMAQLYGCDAANGLWVVPGSNRVGKADIAAMVAAAGSDRLIDAVPLICDPGDVCITSRQAIHGSFANTSPNVRVTVNFGFHRRASVSGVRSGGVHNAITEYTDEYIFERSKVLAYAIDARAQRFGEHQRYRYEPFVGVEDDYRWSDAAREAIVGYNERDIGI